MNINNKSCVSYKKVGTRALGRMELCSLLQEFKSVLIGAAGPEPVMPQLISAYAVLREHVIDDASQEVRARPCNVMEASASIKGLVGNLGMGDIVKADTRVFTCSLSCDLKTQVLPTPQNR